MVGDGHQREGREQRERGHESQLEAEQLQLPADQQAAADEDPVGDVHPRPQRDPPQILRFGELGPESDESYDQAEVRGIEDVAALPADQILRRHRDDDDRYEDPDPVQTPPVTVQRPGSAQDEGRAVSGEQAAGRPQDDLVLEEGDDELEESPDGETDEDLRH